MANSELEKLVETQRETVQALAALTEQLRSGPRAAGGAESDAGATRGGGEGPGGAPGRVYAGLERKGSAAGSPGVAEAGIREETELGRVLELTSRVVGDLGQATRANTQALAGLSRELGGLPALLAGLAGGLKDGGGLLDGILKSGFGLASLGLKIAGLFGGGQREEAAPLSRFVEPPSLALELANTDNILAGFPRVDQGQQGEVRTIEPQRTVLYQPQVTVNVSAMDSRSFLDRSGDIARAMREAMLHMHPVNDLISEL